MQRAGEGGLAAMLAVARSERRAGLERFGAEADPP